jgi:hypothetical protein
MGHRRNHPGRRRCSIGHTGGACTQAQKFGTAMMIAEGATRPTYCRKSYPIEIGDGLRVQARAVGEGSIAVTMVH